MLNSLPFSETKGVHLHTWFRATKDFRDEHFITIWYIFGKEQKSKYQPIKNIYVVSLPQLLNIQYS